MKPVKIHCNNGLPLNLKFQSEKFIELFVDSLSCLQTAKNPNIITVLFLCEPNEIQHLCETTIKYSDRVDFILTHDENVLKTCSNAIEFSFGTSWVENESIPEKKFSVSHIVGHKLITNGHILRHKIWYKQDKIKIAKNFFLSKYNTGIENFVNAPILNDSKQPLFTSQFHICIENVRKKYFFTEKIVDCMLMKSIPIYWGCTNIGDYFNQDGIIVCNSLEEIIEKTNQLTPDTYNSMIEVVEQNYDFAIKWANISERMDETLKNITNKQK